MLITGGSSSSKKLAWPKRGGGKKTPSPAIRLQATRLKVWRRGQLVATAQPATSTLCIPGRPSEVDFLHKTSQGAKS